MGFLSVNRKEFLQISFQRCWRHHIYSFKLGFCRSQPAKFAIVTRNEPENKNAGIVISIYTVACLVYPFLVTIFSGCKPKNENAGIV